MSVNINFPNPWTFDTSSSISGGLDTSMAITEIPQINTNSSFAGNVSSESSFAITQLPEIQFGVTELPQINIQLGIKPVRIHFPFTMKFAVCGLGMELLSFSTCGESMVVVEDYHPHAREQCR